MKPSPLLPVLGLALLLALPSLAEEAAPPPLDAERRAAIVDKVAAALEEIYVFPDVAREMNDLRHRLIPMGDDRFALEGLDDFRIRFERDATGAVVTLVGLYAGGGEEPSPRSGD